MSREAWDGLRHTRFFYRSRNAGRNMFSDVFSFAPRLSLEKIFLECTYLLPRFFGLPLVTKNLTSSLLARIAEIFTFCKNSSAKTSSDELHRFSFRKGMSEFSGWLVSQRVKLFKLSVFF